MRLKKLKSGKTIVYDYDGIYLAEYDTYDDAVTAIEEGTVYDDYDTQES